MENAAEVIETQPGETKDERDARIADLESTNRQLFERAKKAEGFVKVDGKWVKAPKAEEAVRTEAKLEATTGELSETQLDYLDLKGINDDEDIAVIQNVMKRAGLTVRQALNDDYVKSKLEANAETRKTRAATPSSTKRTGQADTTDLSFALARYEQTGELPKDFALRAKVIEAKASKESDSIPPWRR